MGGYGRPLRPLGLERPLLLQSTVLAAAVSGVRDFETDACGPAASMIMKQRIQVITSTAGISAFQTGEKSR